MKHHFEGTAWAGREVRYFDSLDSTNRRAKALAFDGAAHGTLVLADAQTQGRGRRGRSWISPAGEGVFLSLILRPGGDPAGMARLSLTCALAAAGAIERAAGLNARIKWPNDIVCRGRKVCGMLLEMTADARGETCVVAGVGVNVHQREFDEEIAHSASSLDLLSGRRIPRSAVVSAFLSEFEAAYALAPDALMRAYRARSATLGQKVRVIGADGEFSGTAQDVTDAGSLIVIDETGAPREVLAADVSVRGVMGYA